MTELQRGANIILAHWHYYKKDFDPLNMDIRMREKTCLNFLTVEQLTFIVQSFRDAAKKRTYSKKEKEKRKKKDVKK